MARFDRPGMLALRQKALPACIAALFSVTAFAASAGRGPAELPAQPENVRIVTNCDDAGGGSLRDAVTNAVSGDVIDLSGLACSKITLTNGKLSATMGDLMLLGSGVGPDATHPLTIYGYHDQIIDHGTGTLVISGLRLIGGSAYGKGGCVSSQGSLVIESSIVSGCGAYSPAGANVVAAGGAVFAAQDLWIHKSAITDSFAYAGTEVSYGGGVFASGIVTIEDSTIAGNKAIAPNAYAVGGGVAVVGVDDVLIMSSTISGNEATFGGGLHIDTLGTTEVVDGTLSGNYAAAYGGAGSFYNGPVRLMNSTVTRNTASAYTAGIFSNLPMTVQSSLLADNRAVAIAVMFDICVPMIGGGSNLILSSCHDTPPDTRTACPRLTALADHGGPTLTHALLPGGEGIDRGDNTLALASDQRGAQDPRVFGMSADIGAYEWQGERDDEMFRSAFEVVCDEY